MGAMPPKARLPLLCAALLALPACATGAARTFSVGPHDVVRVSRPCAMVFRLDAMTSEPAPATASVLDLGHPALLVRCQPGTPELAMGGLSVTAPAALATRYSYSRLVDGPDAPLAGLPMMTLRAAATGEPYELRVLACDAERVSLRVTDLTRARTETWTVDATSTLFEPFRDVAILDLRTLEPVDEVRSLPAGEPLSPRSLDFPALLLMPSPALRFGGVRLVLPADVAAFANAAGAIPDAAVVPGARFVFAGPGDLARLVEVVQVRPSAGAQARLVVRVSPTAAGGAGR